MDNMRFRNKKSEGRQLQEFGEKISEIQRRLEKIREMVRFQFNIGLC